MLKDMTPAEKFLSKRMKNQGYTDVEIERQIMGIRSIPPEEKQETLRLMKESAARENPDFIRIEE